MTLAHAQPAANPPGPKLDALIEKARQDGRVHLIVGVKAAAIPEGYLANASDVARQRSAIARAQEEFLRLLPGGSHTVKVRYETTPYIALSVNAAALPGLLHSPKLQSVMEDEYVPLALNESGPLVGATNAAALGYTGSGQTVAVLDTGVDRDHSHLAGKVVSEACYSSTNATYTSVCPGGGSGSTAPGSGVPCLNGSGSCFHGTHVAGIVAANGATVKGIARDATLIAIQVFSRRISDGAILAEWSDIKSGLDRVAALRTSFDIAAANLSLGTGITYSSACDSSYSAIASSIDQLKSFDIATVIASGNSSSSTGLSAPACISSAIAVGNTTKSDVVWSTSNSAAILDLLAPGTSITSTVPNNGFGSATGTSMAAPHVAGAWAILHALTRPVDEILTKLVETGLPITDTRNQITKPRIRVDLAAQAVDGPVLASFGGAAQSVTEGNTTVTVTINLSAAASDPVTVPWTVSGSASNPADHDATTGSVTLAPGQTSATTSFTVVGDTLDEYDETVVLTMGTPINASRVPDAFTFIETWDVAPGSTQTSNPIAVSGTDATVKVTVAGGSYSKNGGAYTTAVGSAVAGDTFRVKHTAAGYGGSRTTTLTIGGVSGSFTSYTMEEPLCPGCIPP